MVCFVEHSALDKKKKYMRVNGNNRCCICCMYMFDGDDIKINHDDSLKS